MAVDGRVARAVARESDVHRFWALTRLCPDSTCLWWVGAITNRGHGRFWVGEGRVMIAHRFAWAIAYGPDALTLAPLLAHWVCDNPLCVNAEHLQPATAAQNSRSWSLRRSHWAGPFADPRGPRRRARAIRDGLRDGRALDELLEEGMTALERGQLTLW